MSDYNGYYRDVAMSKEVKDWIKGLEAENKILKEALSFYADKENWAQTINNRYNLGKIWVEAQGTLFSSITLECGQHARQALKECKEIKC